MAVPMVAGGTFTAGTPEKTPEKIVSGDYGAPQGGRNYDVSPDGRRFLVIKNAAAPAGQAAIAPRVIVVQNWLEELKRLVPAN